ncbi:S1C family serine protease [Piscinibacter sp. HJYY11]|uniref:S1C family serine protease n=1 Tax=Piscinibacter sp. HJYY11 TaxID=2801333 RepID=UPI00191DB6D8|nr:S1C family serine protease [Piscinibacter sp. HJYY11]MBL0728647.1 serine protease [Piscinibacter sp. HJYY11]
MKHRPAFAARVVAAVVAGLALGTAQAMTPTEMYNQVSPSVWRVTTYDRDGLPLGQGSGVVIAPEAVVTNCHVLSRAMKVSVRDGKTSLPAKLTHWDPQRDVCQLKVPGLQAPAVVLGDTSQAKVGQDVYTIGAPQGLERTISAGLLSAFRRNENNQLVTIQTSAAISGGSSGGGLFDANGRLLGLITKGMFGGTAQNLNFAIPVDWVRELPDRHARLNAPAQAASAASGAAAPAPAGDTAKPATTTTTSSRETAALNDLSRLPYANDRMRERYSQFLTRPLPRAFVISEGGDWRLAWGKPTGGASAPPAERAMKECEALKRGRCFVYAVDNEVVYRPQ